MKRDRFSSLGVGQNIKRAWLDATLDMVIAQTAPEETRKRLFAIVSGSETKDGLRGKESAKKVLSMLSAWFAPKEQCLAVFAGQMLKIAQQCFREERVALHWAILSATYPFFMEVSLVAGRLFGMQGSIFRQQIQRRLEEMRGASSTNGRNLEYALWILCDLGLLRRGDAKGEYLKCDPLPIVNRSLVSAKHELRSASTDRRSLPKAVARVVPQGPERWLQGCIDDAADCGGFAETALPNGALQKVF